MKETIMRLEREINMLDKREERKANNLNITADVDTTNEILFKNDENIFEKEPESKFEDHSDLNYQPSEHKIDFHNNEKLQVSDNENEQATSEKEEIFVETKNKPVVDKSPPQTVFNNEITEQENLDVPENSGAKTTKRKKKKSNIKSKLITKIHDDKEESQDDLEASSSKEVKHVLFTPEQDKKQEIQQNIHKSEKSVPIIKPEDNEVPIDQKNVLDLDFEQPVLEMKQLDYMQREDRKEEQDDDDEFDNPFQLEQPKVGIITNPKSILNFSSGKKSKKGKKGKKGKRGRKRKCLNASILM